MFSKNPRVVAKQKETTYMYQRLMSCFVDLLIAFLFVWMISLHHFVENLSEPIDHTQKETEFKLKNKREKLGT